MKRKVKLFLGILGAIVLLLTVSIFAVNGFGYFSSQKEIANNQITTGTLDLSLDAGYFPLNYSNIYPGWHYQDAGHWGSWVDGDPDTDIILQNSGTLALKYRMKVLLDSNDNALPDNLLVSISLNRGTGGSWETIYKGNLRDLLNAGYIEVESNFQTSGHSGWWGQGQLIRVNMALPSEVENEVSGLGVNCTIVFEATQTNNPGY